MSAGDDQGRAQPESSTSSQTSARSVASERRGARRTLLAACAALLTSVALGFPGSGCLNPMPEEFPSSTEERRTPVTPERETCADHPQLGECRPEQDANQAAAPAGVDSPAPADPSSDGLAVPEPPLTTPPDEAAPGAGGVPGGDAPSGDAGSDVPADAGAP